jgi:hypothetical protein
VTQQPMDIDKEIYCGFGLSIKEKVPEVVTD